MKKILILGMGLALATGCFAKPYKRQADSCSFEIDAAKKSVTIDNQGCLPNGRDKAVFRCYASTPNFKIFKFQLTFFADGKSMVEQQTNEGTFLLYPWEDFYTFMAESKNMFGCDMIVPMQ